MSFTHLVEIFLKFVFSSFNLLKMLHACCMLPDYIGLFSKKKLHSKYLTFLFKYYCTNAFCLLVCFFKVSTRCKWVALQLVFKEYFALYKGVNIFFRSQLLIRGATAKRLMTKNYLQKSFFSQLPSKIIRMKVTFLTSLSIRHFILLCLKFSIGPTLIRFLFYFSC